ncbi:hypothetical protein B0H63DRAFT_124944 [Podospora didyma]|uniref:Ubiquitin-protein ligase n=1 Tax=Podospora didyma TaxID=330526 RepID=A0AAE0P093_9PEZI|nr:hypothetical protein B0H63DRAFT_124944 [Podospora didyma]
MEDTLLPEMTAPASHAVFNNASVWHNITSWTAQHLGYAMNMSKLAPSLEDLVLAGPRMVMKLGRFGSFRSFHDGVEGFGQRIPPESTHTDIFQTAMTGQLGSLVQPMASATQTAVAAAVQDPDGVSSRFSMEGTRGIGSVFSYATSKWALSCLAMAVIINRTQIFAATRRRFRLRWRVRLLVRLPIIAILLYQARILLQSIHCQTSPDFAAMRWGNATKSSDLMFSQTNEFLHGLSSTLLLGPADQESCQSVKMVPWGDQEQPELYGSLSRLWPLFASFCMSQFIEVLSCTVTGRPIAAETGMTLFEHSLAFAEAESAISNQLGWGIFTNGSDASSSTTLGSTIAVTRAMILRRVNTPPEVLLIGFLSAMGHATSHILALFNRQSRFRLLSTGFWGLCFMGSIMWSAFNFSVDDPSAQGLLRFPTVCIIGFIPHILVLTGVIGCGFVYFLALFLAASGSPEASPDGQRLTIRQRFSRAHENMQANVSFSDIRIRTDMDFYTALLRAGFGAITMASEAVYLCEDRRVSLKRYTWLEDERFREVEELRMQWIGGGIPGGSFDSVGTIGLVPIKAGQGSETSGYAREKAAQKIPKDSSARRIRNGVGASERSGRWMMAVDYIMHINRLLLITAALLILRFLAFVGIQNPPRFLRWLAQRPKAESPDTKRTGRPDLGRSPQWITVPGTGADAIQIPAAEWVDVEEELRRRMKTSESKDADVEEEMDSRLYSWWLKGGWWGNNDLSGEYKPPVSQDDAAGPDDVDFDDTTSVISTTETASEYGWESDNDDDGQRTPTQSTPTFTSFSQAVASARSEREITPLVDSPMATSDLARLLNPRSPEDREEARALAAHLTSDTIMTRSRFRQHQQHQRAQVLLTNRQHYSLGLEKMSPDEEAQRLEQVLLSRRSAAATNARGSLPSNDGKSWATGAAGLGPEGPQCVVCQSASRTIIVWPCRCLSLCDDCRVSLAMNNFDKCVCCRREVISFSRIYVP